MHIEKKTLRRIFIGVGICILLYWFLHEVEQVDGVLTLLGNIFSPFILGAGLAFIINVPMRSIENKLLKGIKLPVLRRTIALVITLILFALVLTLVFYLLIPQLITTGTKFVEQLPGFYDNAKVSVTDFLNDHPKLMEWVNEYVDPASFDYSTILQKAIDFVGDGVSVVFSGIVSAITDLAGTVVSTVIGLMFGMYCLFSKESLARQGRKILYAFLPEKWSDNIIRVLRMTNTTFSNFLSGQCLEVCILGTMFAITMAIFKMPYISLVSVLVAVTAFIPVVGAYIGCIFGSFFILVDDPSKVLGFIIMFIVLQQLEGNLIYPRVVGTSIGLPGMWVLMAVAVGSELMGVAGMFLMIPLASVLYTLLRESTTKRLESRNIDQSKLEVQPPELRSRIKKHVERIKGKKKKSTEDKSE